jgi:hypothetical protein
LKKKEEQTAQKAEKEATSTADEHQELNEASSKPQ